MDKAWIISFCIVSTTMLFAASNDYAAPPLHASTWKPSARALIQRADRSLNSQVMRYLNIKKKRAIQNKKFRPPLRGQPKRLFPFNPARPAQNGLHRNQDQNPLQTSKFIPSEFTTLPVVSFDEQISPLPGSDSLGDLTTDFVISELEKGLIESLYDTEMGVKPPPFIQPHLINGKGVYLSLYEDREESLAPLSPIPFLHVASQSTFNYIEDIGVIFIPVDGTFLIKYGFAGDGMHWGNQESSIQLTINETKVIPNSTITANQEGLMASHSIILPLKVNDRVRLINSTPTSSMTLTQGAQGGITAYLEMILLK